METAIVGGIVFFALFVLVSLHGIHKNLERLNQQLGALLDPERNPECKLAARIMTQVAEINDNVRRFVQVLND